MPTRILSLILILGLTSACGLIKTTLELPDKAISAILSLNREGVMVDPVELQSQLIRFSDYYLGAMNLAIPKLRKDGNELPDRRELLMRRILISNDVLAIATGSNAYANLLDMTILVTLNSSNIEDYWMPKRFGETAKPLLIAAQDSEREIWRIAESVLNKSQIFELRNGIKIWHDNHPDSKTSREIGTLGIASEISKMVRNSRTDGASVFNLLMIDPFSGLDPATREIADTRLFAERGLFLARHMPTLIRWETELLALQTAEMPQVDKLLSNTGQFAAAAERFSQVSEHLPAFLSSERKHIVQALDSQRPGLLSLAVQSEKTLAAGKQMSEATNAALKTFQDILKQLDNKPSDPNSEPFRISDYTAAAEQISIGAKELSKLLEAFNSALSPERLDTLSARLDLLTSQTQASGKTVVDYAFNRLLLLGVILIGLTCLTFLISSLSYWKLKNKFGRQI